MGHSVLMISPQYYPLVGGYERAAERLSAALVARGYSVTVITEHRDKAWPTVENRDGVMVRRLWCIYRLHFHMITALTSFALYLLIHGRRFDIWHVHQYGLHAALASALGMLLRRPVVLKLTSSSGQGLASVAVSSRFSLVTQYLHRRVPAIVALTRETVSEALAFGIAPERIHLLGNGVDTVLLRPHNDLERSENKHRLGVLSRHVVIFVGRFSREKNPEGLLRAWSKAQSVLGPDWKLVMVGDGPMRSELESIVKLEGLENTVLIAGQQPNVDQWYALGDIYISTSHWEGLSNTLLEAMSCGLPVVVTRVSGTVDLVEETGAGIVVEAGDEVGLSSALIKLANNVSLRCEMGAMGRQVINNRYSIDKIAQMHENLYLELFSSGKF